MFAESESALDGAHAMLVKRGRFFGAIWQIIVGFFLRFGRAGFKEGNLLVQNAGVRDTRNVTACHVRQP